MSRAGEGKLGAALALFCWAGAAWGNSFETFGFGPRETAMAGAATADASDYTAVFFNPARLVIPKELSFGFSYSWYRASAQVESGDPQRPLDAYPPPDAAGYTTGLLVPLAGKVKNRLALGVGLHLPGGRLLRALAPDPTRPHWYFFHAGPERFLLYAGAGVRLSERLSLGVGFHALADLLGSGVNAEVDLFSKRVKARELDAHFSTRVAPLAALYFAPFPRLRLGASFRGQLGLAYRIPAKLDLEGVAALELRASGVTHYSPHTLSLGAAYDATPDLTLTLDGQWMNWSAAPSPYMDLEVDLSGDTLRALGLDEALDLAAPRSPPGFSDTLGARLGAELRRGERFAARGGVFYRPTPVPGQDAPGTNILDASAVGLTGGIGVAFDDPLEVLQHPLKLDLAAQLILLPRREAKKELTDELPPYSYSVTVFGGSAALSYEL